MKRLASILLISCFALGAVACDKGKPCDKVMEKMCAAAGEEMCGELKKKMGEEGPTDKDQAECEAMLKDDKKMGEMLEGLKAAAALKKALDGAKKGGDKPADKPAEAAPTGE